jgi:acetyl esterase/lipase
VAAKAAALAAADAPVTLEAWPHMLHVWPMGNAKLEEGRRALAQAGEFMKSCLSGATSIPAEKV